MVLVTAGWHTLWKKMNDSTHNTIQSWKQCFRLQYVGANRTIFIINQPNNHLNLSNVTTLLEECKAKGHGVIVGSPRAKLCEHINGDRFERSSRCTDWTAETWADPVHTPRCPSDGRLCSGTGSRIGSRSSRWRPAPRSPTLGGQWRSRERSRSPNIDEHLGPAAGPLQPMSRDMNAVIIFGLRFAFFTHISGGKRTVLKYVR